MKSSGRPGRGRIMRLILIAFFLFLQLLSCAPALAGPTLEQVRAKGVVRCGVSAGLMGFSQKDGNGHWQGFDIEFSRAVAAAVLENADKVSFVTVTTVSRFPVLLSGQIPLRCKPARNNRKNRWRSIPLLSNRNCHPHFSIRR